MKFLLAAIASLAAATVAGAASATFPAGPVHDPGGVLSREATGKVVEATKIFEALTGRRLVVMVLPRGQVPGLPAPDTVAGVPLGIVYATTPDDPAGQLLIADPVWQQALPAQWRFMYPQRLAQKYGEEPFERRVVLGAEYLATVVADKIVFVLKPRGGQLSPGSARFARGSYIGLQILGFFIIFFTVFRTFWPARLRDEDQDAFSNEIRRLKKERQIW